MKKQNSLYLLNDDVKLTRTEGGEAVSGRNGLFFVLMLLLITDAAVLFDIPIWRPVLGLILLFVLPGLLVLYLLRLDEIGTAEKTTLTIGLSTAIIMFYGWALSEMGGALGYSAPLSTRALLPALNVLIFALAGAAYIRNGDAFAKFPFPLTLNIAAKLYLLFPAALPGLAVAAMYLLNTSGDNTALLVLVGLAPLSILVLLPLRERISEHAYPVAVLLLGLALLSIAWLRSEHITGADVHTEYYIFHTTLNNGYWSAIAGNSLDACLSISVLPAAVQSIVHLAPEETFFKGLYVLICSFAPLTVYVISRRYVGALCAVLAAFYFTSQLSFLFAPGSPRTNVAIFFFALFFMVLFHPEITGVSRKILLLIFLSAIVLSHYSTAYIFFFLLAAVFVTGHVLRRYSLSRSITGTAIAFFVVLAFLWYGRVTQAPMQESVRVAIKSIDNLRSLFLEETRSREVGLLFGTNISPDTLLTRGHLYSTWLSIAAIGVGLAGTLLKYRSMIDVRGRLSPLPGFLRVRFEPEYFLLSAFASLMLAAVVVLPYLSVEYDMFRVYSQMAVFLSVFAVIGGITLSKYIKFNGYLLVWLLLTPCFLYNTWAAYEFFGVHRHYLMSAEAPSCRYELAHDQEIAAAEWLKAHMTPDDYVCACDNFGKDMLVSQGKIAPQRVDYHSFFEGRSIESFLYLNWNNVSNHEFLVMHKPYELGAYFARVADKSKLYTSDGSEIYR
jgi:uncharacterized membrane protein